MNKNLIRKMLMGAGCALLVAGTPSVVLAQNAGQAEPSAHTLHGVLANVINSNPKVLSQWRAMQAARDEIDVAQGGYLPTVDVTAGAGWATRGNDGMGSFDTQFARLEITQMLYDGGFTPNEVERLTHASLVAYYQLLDTVQNVSLEAVQSYLGVRRYRELVDLARDNYASHIDVYNQIQARVEAGAGTQANLEQITGRLALAKSNLKTAGANLHDVIVRYQRIVGQLPPAQLAPVPALDENIPATPSRTVVRAVENNPAFHAAIENIYATQAKYDRTLSAFLPRLELQARTSTSNQDTVDFHRDESAIELVVSMNLYNGGSDSAERHRALDLVKKAKHDRKVACVNLRQTTLIAYNDIREKTQQLRFLRQHAVSSGRVLTAYRQQFRIGARTLLDVLDSENEYFQARRAYVTAQYDLKYAYARTQAKMGRLLVATGIQSKRFPTLSELGSDPLKYDAEAFCPGVGVQGFTMAELIGNPIPSQPVQEPDFVLSGSTLFALNKYNLTEQAKARLNEVAAGILSINDLQGVLVAGYTDTTGTPAINQPLSENRAQSVAHYLIAQGVDASLVTTRGYGAKNPVESNATAAGRQANRRVEITLDRASDDNA